MPKTSKHTPKFMIKKYTKEYMKEYGVEEHIAWFIAVDKVLKGLLK